MSLTQINKAGLDEIALDHVFTIGASGTDHYTFQGEGINGTVNDPTLYLTRGKTYRFENGTGGHPIRIQSTQGASGTAYNTGVTNNASAGTVIVEVQHDAPDVLYYQCTSHPNMNGILYITGALADGGVTTAKLADDAVTNDKLANSVVASIAANTAKTSNATHTGDVTGSTSLTIANDAVTAAKIADGAIDNSAKIGGNVINNTHMADNAINTAEIADDAVTGAKIGDNAISTNHIADQAVDLTKLEHGTSSNDGKFLRANNGADPTFETVTGTTINNNADNRVITGSGTANTLEGEANLTFDGSKLQVNNSSLSQVVQSYSGNNRFKTLVGSNFLQMITQNDVSLQFRYATDTGSGNEICRITSHGLSFDGNAAADSLDDYEEGTFSAHGYDSSGNQFNTGFTGKYTKVGNRVHISIFFFAYGGSANKTMGSFRNLPFSGVSEPHATGVICRTSGGNHVNIEHEESCYLSQGGTQIRMKNNYGTGSSKNNVLSLTYMTTA